MVSYIVLSIGVNRAFMVMHRKQRQSQISMNTWRVFEKNVVVATAAAVVVVVVDEEDDVA